MKKLFLLIGFFVGFFACIFGQDDGDFISKQTGDWDVIANWQIWSDFDFGYIDASAYPTNNNSTEIIIASNHTITIPSDLTLSNLSGHLTGQSSANIVISGDLSLTSSGQIHGGSITTFFPNITINGTLTVATILNSTNLTINSGGRLETSWYHASAQSEGWWYSTYSPSTTGSTLSGTVEFTSSTDQNIATLLPYNNLEISTTGTTVSGDLDVTGTLTVNTGASLNIASATDATIGTLVVTDANSLTLESDASMIISTSLTGTGAATVDVQRIINENMWHLISIPLSDYTMSDMTTENTISVNPGNTNPSLLNHVALAYFDEGTNSWITSTSPSGNMAAGVGYMTGVSDPADETLSFTGTPNYGNYTVTGTNSLYTLVNTILVDPFTGKGNNAVGNPYTSSLDVDAFIDHSDNGAAIDGSYSAIYTYNPSTNQYDTNYGTDGQDYIQSCQGFLLKADSDGGALSFTTDMQAHSTNTFYKKSAKDEDYSLLELYIANGEGNLKTKIYFKDNASTGLDRGNDLGIIKRSEDFNIYTKLVDDNGIDFITQSLPNTNFEDFSIPVGVDLTAGGMITFYAESINLPEECLAILEDRELEVYTDLKAADASYSVELPENTMDTGRFFLHTFNPQTVNVDIDDLQNITIFAFEKEIIVQGEITERGQLSVYDLSGRMVKSAMIESGNRHLIPASELKEGIYIIHLNVEGNTKVSKLFLH